MHVFDGERKAAEDVVRAYRSSVEGRKRCPMPRMPGKPGPLSQVNQLVRLEAALRHDHRAIGNDPTDKLLSRGSGELKPYWLAFYRVLLAHALSRAGRHEVAGQVADELPSYFKMSVVQHLQRIKSAESEKSSAAGLPLFPEPSVPDAPSRARDAIAAAFAPTVDDERRARDELHAICKSIEAQQGRHMLRSEYEEVERRLITQRPISLAARSEPGAPGSPSDRAKLALAEVEKVLSDIRQSPAK